VILSCPTCRQLSRHPPHQMLGRWAICPHCGGEIDWRERTPVGDTSTPNEFPLPDDLQENER